MTDLPLLSVEEISWLAGLLEAAGSFGFVLLTYGPNIKVRVATIDEDVVHKAARMMNVDVRCWRRYRESGKYVFEANAYGSRALQIMELILPYMGSRHTAKIEELLLAISTHKI